MHLENNTKPSAPQSANGADPAKGDGLKVDAGMHTSATADIQSFSLTLIESRVAPSAQQAPSRGTRSSHGGPVPSTAGFPTSRRLTVETFAALTPKSVSTSSIRDAMQFSVPDETLDKLLKHDRFTARLGEILEDYHKPQPIDVNSQDGNDLHIAMSALEHFNRLILTAGALWNGAYLRTTLQKADVSEIVRLVDRKTLAFAVKNAMQPPPSNPPAKLAESIRADGLQCFFAWASSATKAIVQRVELRMPELFSEKPVVAEVFKVNGCAVLSQAAQFIRSSADGS